MSVCYCNVIDKNESRFFKEIAKLRKWRNRLYHIQINRYSNIDEYLKMNDLKKENVRKIYYGNRAFKGEYPDDYVLIFHDGVFAFRLHEIFQWLVGCDRDSCIAMDLIGELGTIINDNDEAEFFFDNLSDFMKSYYESKRSKDYEMEREHERRTDNFYLWLNKLSNNGINIHYDNGRRWLDKLSQEVNNDSRR